MAVQIFKQFFSTREQVLDDIKRSGFWPTTLITPIGGQLPIHFHDSDVHAYVMAGSSWILDAATGERLVTCAGDKFIIPHGELHAEGETTTEMTYIIGLPEARPMKQFLRMQLPTPAQPLGG